MKLLWTKFPLLLLTVLTTVCLISEPIFADSDFGLPTDITNDTYDSDYIYRFNTKNIPNDAGTFRDFEIPYDSDTKYYSAIGNYTSSNSLTEITYNDFRLALYNIKHHSYYNSSSAKYASKILMYSKFFRYSSNRSYTGKYMIGIYFNNGPTYRNYNSFDVNKYSYTDVYANNTDSYVTFDDSKTDSVVPSSILRRDTYGVNYETNTIEFFVHNVGSTSGQIPLAFYDSDSNSWIVNNCLFDSSFINLSNCVSSISNFANYFKKINSSYSGTPFNIYNPSLFGFYYNDNPYPDIEYLSKTSTSDVTINDLTLSYDKNDLNDFVTNKIEVNGVYGLAYHRFIDIQCTYDSDILVGTIQHNLYNVFESTDLPCNDPYSNKVQYQVSITSNNTEYGIVTGDTSVLCDYDDQITFNAVPISNAYKFIQWSDGNKNPSRTISISQNLELVATFAPKDSYTITLLSNPETSGHFEGQGGYYEGDTATIKAVPYTGYSFSHWSDGDENQERSIGNIQSDLELEAYFVEGETSTNSINIGNGEVITMLFLCTIMLMLKGNI